MNVGDAVVVVRYVGEDFSRRGVIQDIGAIFIDVLFEGETLGYHKLICANGAVFTYTPPKTDESQ